MSEEKRRRDSPCHNHTRIGCKLTREVSFFLAITVNISSLQQKTQRLEEEGEVVLHEAVQSQGGETIGRERGW